MDLLHVVITLAIFGLILYLVQTYIPMAQPIKTIINAVVAIVIILWLLQIAGVGRIAAPIR